MIFQCETRQEVDRSGEVSMIAVHWTEARRLTEKALYWCGALTFCVGATTTLIGFAQSNGFGVLGLLLLVVSGFAFWNCLVLSGRPRVMQLHRDGTIVTPLGTTLWPKHKTAWGWKLGHIMRVEKEQLEQPHPNDAIKYYHGVRMFMRSGEIICIARYLEPDDAHMLAVRLNAAIEELRSTKGASAVGRVVSID